MQAVFTEKARDDLRRMDGNLVKVFFKHVEKIVILPPRRHMRFGMPFNVDEVGSGRLVYDYKDDALIMVRCFSNRRDYEKWYKAYR